MSDIVPGLRNMNLKMADLAADEITRLRSEVERLKAGAGLPEMALGFAHAWCCSLLDQGIDPRQVEVPKLLEDWNKVRQKGGGE